MAESSHAGETVIGAHDALDLPAPRTTVTGASTNIYNSEWVSLDLVEVTTRTGRTYQHHVVDTPYVCVGVVLVHPEWGVLLNHRHRFTTGTVGLEIPAGMSEAGESHADAARRELMEETGWTARNLEPLIEFEPLDGLARTHMAIFAGVADERVSAPTDTDELSPIYWLPTTRITEAVQAGLVPCGMTLTSLLAAQALGRFT